MRDMDWPHAVFSLLTGTLAVTPNEGLGTCLLNMFTRGVVKETSACPFGRVRLKGPRREALGFIQKCPQVTTMPSCKVEHQNERF